MPPLSRRAVLLLLLASGPLSLGACRSTALKQPPPPTTRVFVQNSEFLDVVVYLVHRGQSLRLGTASSNSTTRFVIPPQLIFGATAISFIADPVGSPRRIGTSEIVVEAGDDIEVRLTGGRALINRRTP